MDYRALYAQLDRFPHIQRKLDVLWGSEFCRPFLLDLITPVRPGRAGFDFSTLNTIQDLLILHDQTFSQFAPVSVLWQSNGLDPL